jgi:HK97 family phage major capsid protein
MTVIDLKGRIGDMLEERATLVNQQREILDGAETEKRELTTEDRQKYDKTGERVIELQADIRRYESQVEAEEFAGAERKAPAREGGTEEGDGEVSVRDRLASDEYRDAFNAFARGEDLTDEQRSTLNAGTDAEGGYTVAEQWTALHERLRESGTVRGLAEILTTETGGELHLPREKPEGGDAAEPGIVDEGEEIPDDADEFDEAIFNAYKIARMTKAEEEMVQDALFDVAGYVGRRLGFQLGRAANKRYINGSGAGEPEGLFSKGIVAMTLASKTAIASDEIIDLSYKVIAPYRKVPGTGYMANDLTIGAIQKIKDSTGRYLWQASVQVGRPDSLNGYPVYPDPDVPALGSKAHSLGFGNVNLAYGVRDVLGVTIKFLDQTFAAKDQVAWRGKLRTDGRYIDPNAFKVAACPE